TLSASHTTSLHDALPICFVGADEPQLWGIDHGLTFHVHPKLRTVIWDFCGQPISQELLEAMEALEREADRVRATLRPYLTRQERSEEHTSKLQSRENVVC